MKKIVVLLLATVMVLSMTACSGTAAAQSDVTAKSSTAAVSAAETTAAAVTATNLNDTGVLKLQWFQSNGVDTLFQNPWVDKQCLLPYMVFEPLIAQNADGSYVGNLATEWSVSDDNLTYTFTVAENVTWHDGEAFSAEDVAFSLYGALADPNGVWKTDLKYIKGASAVSDEGATELSGVVVDGNTVTITLTAPNRNFLSGIAKVMILPKHCLGDVAPAEYDTNEAFWSKPVGTGLYMIDKVSFPDYCTVIAYDNFHGEKAAIKNVQFTSYDVGGNDAVVSALIAGELDYAYGNAVNDIEVANNVTAQNADTETEIQTGYYTRYFVFNTASREDGNDKKDIQNAAVRQAFNMIIDKESVAGFYEGQAVPLTTFINPASSQYNDDIVTFSRNVEAAAAMLKEAGFDFSQTIDIAYYYDDQTTSDIMAMLVQNFAEAGITVKTTLLSGDLATLLYKTRNYDIVYCAWSGATDPIALYGDMVSSGAKNAILGHVEERAKIFDTIMAAYNATTTEEEAKKYGDEMQATAAQYCYTLPIYSLNSIAIMNKTIVSIPKEIFKIDNVTVRNWRFAEWNLVG